MSVTVESYNPEWPYQFLQIKSRLQTYLQDVSYISIEHIGSTSVPALAAKPIIDVDIIVHRDNVQATVDALITEGNFTYLGELGIVDRHALRDPCQVPARNIYVCVEGAFQTRNHIAIRDTLRSNPSLREEYGRVKLDLAAQGTNIVDYIEAKSGIVQKILKEAGLLTDEELAAVESANRKGERFGAIKTERLIIREFVMSDVDAYYELESIPEVVKYQTWQPRTKEEAHRLVLANIQNSCQKPRTNIELAVSHDDQFIGRMGANTEQTSDGPLVNLWYSFMPTVQGKGFATEAMQAFIPKLGSPLNLEIECDPRNTASCKMAERLGFEKLKLTERAFESKGEWVDSLIYRKLV